MLTRLLDEEGYAVDPAPDGQRGLHLGLTREYDLLVLDRGLPAIEGLDLLGRLRSRGVSTPDARAVGTRQPGRPGRRARRRRRGLPRQAVRHRRAARPAPGTAAPAPGHGADADRSPGGRLDLDSRRVVDDPDGRPGSIQLSERECAPARDAGRAARHGCSRATSCWTGCSTRRGQRDRRRHLRALPAAQAGPRRDRAPSAAAATSWASGEAHAEGTRRARSWLRRAASCLGLQSGPRSWPSWFWCWWELALLVVLRSQHATLDAAARQAVARADDVNDPPAGVVADHPYPGPGR